MLLASEKPSAKVNERISYLLDHFSPSPNVQDIHGLTVIHHLASSKLSDTEQTDIVQTAKLLLNGGADLNMKDYALDEIDKPIELQCLKNQTVQNFCLKGNRCTLSQDYIPKTCLNT